MTEIKDIPQEKFQLVGDKNLSHDIKLDTKPRSYLHDAFSRFCKNKGSVVAACVIIVLVLFAIIAPLCTPYTVAYEDITFKYALPKLHLFEHTNFWDGCEEKNDSRANFIYFYAMSTELIGTEAEDSAHYAIKNLKYEETDFTFIDWIHISNKDVITNKFLLRNTNRYKLIKTKRVVKCFIPHFA